MVGTTQLRRHRLFAIALVAAIGSTTIVASPAQAAAQYFLAPNGIYYQYEEGGDFSSGASVKGYFGDPGVAVTIPESVTTPHGSFEVLHVMADGFRDAALSGMTIEADLHTIGNSGFRGAFTGGHLTVPDSVTTIAAAAFADNDLDGITLPSGLTELAGNLFDGSNLTSIDIPDGVTKIGARAFEGNQLSTIEIPDAVTTIEGYAFYQNDLTDIDLGSSLQTMDFAAFRDNELASVTIPASMTAIAGEVFLDNPDLTSVRMLGAPPVVASAGAQEPTFDTSSGSLVVHHRAALADPPTAGGYTSPTWQGYTTKPYLSGLATVGIGGNPREGYTVTALPGAVDPNAELAYQWKADSVPIAGATSSTLKLGGYQAARRISVTVTATYPGADSLVRTSGTTRLISSPHKRIVLSKKTVKKGTGFAVTATGFKPYQTVKIILSGHTRYTGRADATGMVNQWVTFKSSTTPGVRSVRVSGYSPSSTILTWITYVK